eukprot:4360369-Amphidinium_carterae.1
MSPKQSWCKGFRLVEMVREVLHESEWLDGSAIPGRSKVKKVHAFSGNSSQLWKRKLKHSLKQATKSCRPMQRLAPVFTSYNDLKTGTWYLIGTHVGKNSLGLPLLQHAKYSRDRSHYKQHYNYSCLSVRNCILGSSKYLRAMKRATSVVAAWTYPF